MNQKSFVKLYKSLYYKEFYQKICDYLCVLCVLCGTNRVNQQNKKMQFMPKVNKPNLHQVAYFNNEQRTMSNEQFSNKPNFKFSEIDLTTVIEKDYINNDVFALPKNKPNRTQFKPSRRKRGNKESSL